MFGSREDLLTVGKAIEDLVKGTRQVRVEFTDVNGRRTSRQFTDVSLNQLINLQSQMMQALSPTPVMESIDIEVVL